MKVSVIIPSYDRPNTLKQVINSYLCQEGIGELIVIDDGSSKDYTETNRYIESRIENSSIKYVYHKNEKNMGAAFCRNLGVSLANYEYILWGEDDAFLSGNYLKCLISKTSDNTILCGSIYYGITPWMKDEQVIKLIQNQQNSYRPIFDLKLFEGYYRKVTKEDVEVPFGHALILVPKKAYSFIKYYENYKVNGYREESDAQVQMVKKGYRIIYTSDTECYHFPGDSVELGGQHKKSRIKQELYTIINTAIFYNRHYSFLKEKYSMKNTKYRMILYFAQNRFTRLFSSATNKIRRK